jgi:hypothetical protein
VHEIEGDVVYAKYLINGEEYQATFDIALEKALFHWDSKISEQ